MTKKEMLFGTMDIIYTKVKPPNLRKLQYKHWLEALLLIARQVCVWCAAFRFSATMNSTRQI